MGLVSSAPAGKTLRGAARRCSPLLTSLPTCEIGEARTPGGTRKAVDYTRAASSDATESASWRRTPGAETQPARFVQADTGGDRNVEARHLPIHPDPQHPV